MENRKVHKAPVPDDGPVQVKSGDFEPTLTTGPLVPDEPEPPEAGGPSSSVPPEAHRTSSRR